MLAEVYTPATLPVVDYNAALRMPAVLLQPPLSERSVTVTADLPRELLGIPESAWLWIGLAVVGLVAVRGRR